MATTTSPIETQIVIKNCNSIEEAAITLRRSALNIKYGPNGLGKSTIARALTLNASETESLDDLIPFAYRADAQGPRPSVTGAESIKTVLTFDDAYVSQFAFQRDEVLKNSFEVFINTKEYRDGLSSIAAMFESLQSTFAAELEFNEALVSFTELRSAFNITKSGAVAKTSRGVKAFSVGAKLHNVPAHLIGYEQFLHSEDPASWITWQGKGKEFLSISDNCPFCSTISLDKELATQVSEEYETAAVKNMSALRTVLDKLGRYIEPTHLEKLTALTTTIVELSPEQETFIVGLREQIETLLLKLTTLKELSFYALRDEPDVGPRLINLKIDLELLVALNSEGTQSVVDLVNAKLDEVAGKVGQVKGAIEKQKTRVAKTIETNQNAINDFLKSAGYKYSVKIVSQDNSYKMLLEHEDAPGHLGGASKHLSYGEKNAFALVLFMHHVQQAKPDLVVLDDPVSSFDKTKKFAIFHQLFQGRNSLRDTTTLFLTHDIEPAIDIVRTGTSRFFQAASPSVCFLQGRSGQVTEKVIEKHDIATFSEICKRNVNQAQDPVIKSIYLRRLFEVHGSTDLEYDVLSSLLHLRGKPTRKDALGNHVELNSSEIQSAVLAIGNYIAGFDYEALLLDLQDVGLLKDRFFATDVGYEKVQLFRVMFELRPEDLKKDEIFTKFINETYHIENEYVMQLDPRIFDAIPEYVVAACTSLMDGVDATSRKEDGATVH
ncbi:AAA family ATPase [Clavibacter michiganensis]|uniref:AAA family ATPase n=1 Tax=Clavibacter michiganensis TaxID=28447 RepID=UPI001BE0391D|nr:AAA family ATPase [Clavibacter michiganensis]MBT1636808.1 AAA family ATPase [Clavibacter michiganensis]